MPWNREREIEDAVIQLPGALGFPGAMAIRNVRVGWRFGRIDLMLFPKGGQTKLVLVEAKHSAAPDSLAKVIGQLLMYYAGALRLGSQGLAYLRDYAEQEREKALAHTWISPKQLTRGISPPKEAFAALQSGEGLRPSEIALFVAVNSSPAESLSEAVRVLQMHHDLTIGIVVVSDGVPRIYKEPRAA